MDQNILIAVIAVAGWIISYKLTIKNKQREISVSFLIEAYRKLENLAHRDTISSDLESVIADIQLFGSKEQLLLSKNVSEGMVKNNKANLEPLLQNLRTDLRKELQLFKIDENIIYFRMNNSKT
ncbi:MAG: hypothetical protein DSY43_01555 [Gammaproteobacteria bacterium]|nr:MAG: hypothetical protein DSY43_01555 [Gammaproteobacteria bacterium]